MNSYEYRLLYATAWLLAACMSCSTDSGPGLGMEDVTSEDMAPLARPRQPAFQAPRFAKADEARRMATIDINGDNNLDLVFTYSDPSVGVILGDGKGSFGVATYFPIPAIPGPVVVADFNLDGKPDVAVLTKQGTSVLLGDGQGRLGAAINSAIGSSLDSIAVGDFNLDKKPDLVIAASTGNTLKVMLGDGVGGFGAPNILSPDSRIQVAGPVIAADFNRDGKPDLAVGYDGISLQLGDGKGGFGPSTWYPSRRIRELAIGDINLDGNLDIVTARDDGGILLGDGRGGFELELDVRSRFKADTVAVADFNGDQKPDLAFSSTSQEWQIFVMPGDGKGGFLEATKLNTDWLCTDMVVGDFNNDQKPDVVVSHGIGVSVLLGRGGPT